MIQFHIRSILSILAAAVLALPLNAQDLPTFKQDSRINVGALPNGVKYYLVTNADSKGYADFALVQKKSPDVPASRSLLSRLDNFPDTKPYAFLSGKGVGYLPDGYISYRKEATVFNFKDVPTFDASAADSTLLVIFDMIRSTSCPQAVVISGDINASQLSERMYAISMTVPRLPDEMSEAEYVWQPSESLECSLSASSVPGVATISVQISSPRVPVEFLNTPQPLVTEMFVRELETILSQRLRRSFRESGVPLGSISLNHVSSAGKAGDEQYTLTVTTEGKSYNRAIEIIASVLGDIDADGATMDEYVQAVNRQSFAASCADLRESNAQYVEKCISAYLYKASLASLADVSGFMMRRRLSDDKGLELFNKFSSALLDPDKAISLRCSIPYAAADAGSLAGTFRRAWSERPFPGSDFKLADTLALADLKSKLRIKLKSESPDPITGGKTWTFSNGMKVIFRKADTKGRIEYGFMVKGGTPNVPGLVEGEAAYVSDMLGMFDVAGMTSEDFRELLAAYGISMDFNVSVSEMSIRGSAPSSKLPFLLKSLLTLSTRRTLNPGLFDYYRECETVRAAVRGYDEKSILDEMWRPENRYSLSRNPEALVQSLPSRAGQYFDSQFTRMNDGVLVIVGDYDEYELPKLLSRSLGNFICGKTTQTRSRIASGEKQGWYTRSYDGNPCVAVSLISDKPFSMEGYITFKVASIALQKEIVKALADQGVYAGFEENVEFFPRDAYTMTVLCRPCDKDGLPVELSEISMYRTLNAVRAATAKLSSANVTAAEVEAYKAALRNVLASHYVKPSSLIDAAITRNSVGRDIVSMYGNYLNGVSVEGVRNMLAELNEGSRMEIVIR